MQDQELETGNKLEKTFWIGLVRCSVWSRTIKNTTNGQPKMIRSVSFDKRFRDKEGNWKSSYWFDHQDLVVVARLAEQSLQYLASLDVEVEPF